MAMIVLLAMWLVRGGIAAVGCPDSPAAGSHKNSASQRLCAR